MAGTLRHGSVLDSHEQPVTGQQVVRAGEVYLRRFPVQAEPPVNGAIRILYEDSALVVVDKPAPLPLHPSGRFNRNSLQSILNLVYAPQRLRPAHRLDANTTGVVVFTRTKQFAGKVQPQFERGEVTKKYLARVHGHPQPDEFVCTAAIGSTAVELGARELDPAGQAAETHFRVLERHDDGTSLLEVRPLTGRTNQIRIHLWELGFPIIGDPVYLPERMRGDTQTTDIEAAPMCLHAWSLEFTHPFSNQRVTYATERPSWAVNG